MKPPATLLGRIYETAIDPRLWREVLTEMASELDASTMGIMIHDRVAGTFRHVGLHPEYPVDAAAEYTKGWAQRDPLRKKAERIGAGKVHSETELSPPEGLSRVEVYNDYYLKWGWGRLLAGYIQRSETEDTMIGIHRPVKRPPFEPERRALVRQILPHIRIALEVMRRLEKAAHAEALSMDALETIESAAVVVDGSGKVLLANTEAYRVTDARDGLLIIGGELTSSSALDSEELRRLIAAAREESAGGRMTIRRRRGAPLYVTVSPCRSCPTKSSILVLVNAPDGDIEQLAADLRERHGLTAAQARIAAALCRGISPDDIAHGLGLSIHTVRSHIKKMTARVGAHSQAQLVAELLRGPGFIAKSTN